MASNNSAISHPPECNRVTLLGLTIDTLPGLQTLADALQSLGQLDDGAKQRFTRLAFYLAKNCFLKHQSKDMQLLIACCISDVLRVYSPEVPYKDPDLVKVIFNFFVEQLAGLKDPKDPAFKRYFYLLENLANVKTFNKCFELDDCQKIFCKLFQLMFSIINEAHSGEVMSVMLEVLCPLITESDNLSNELLDTILINIVEPIKSQRNNAYILAKTIILRCLNTFIKFWNKGRKKLRQDFKYLAIESKIDEVLNNLLNICSRTSVMLHELPQLELKLKSPDEMERHSAASLLAIKFSMEGSVLAVCCRKQWKAFLDCFKDIHPAIRSECIQYCPLFLLNHPELHQEIIEYLFLCQQDKDELVRLKVAKAIDDTADKDASVVSRDVLVELLNLLSSDRVDYIRQKAMSALAKVYRNHLMDLWVPEAITQKAVTWIGDKILHCYYMPGVYDKFTVENLLITYLVPFTLPTEERMKKLLQLVCCVDEKSEKAFFQMQKQQLSIRKLLREFLQLQNRPQDEESRDKELDLKIQQLSNHFPEPIKARHFLHKFSIDIGKDLLLPKLMENFINPEVRCRQCSDIMYQILERLGDPVSTNLYYNTVKMLLERAASVLVDHEAVKVLVGYVQECLQGAPLVEELCVAVDKLKAQRRGLTIIMKLLQVFPSHFLHKDVIRQLHNCLDLNIP